MTTDYKETLNLPETDFPMKANLVKREPEILAQWEKDNVYASIREKLKGKPKFVFHDGPPYANGHIHMGHALNKILKDFIVRFMTMRGYDATFVPGWDCHGLPIEHQVGKKLKEKKLSLEKSEIRKRCRVYAQEFVDVQREEFKRLGVLADWENPYLTMDFKFEADIIRSLGQIIENGHLQKGFKPVYWSVVGGSALAEAEVEYQDKQSTAIDVRFDVVNTSEVLAAFNAEKETAPVSIVIWTTTPWTLPSNQAVSLNADLTYSLVKCDLGQGEEIIIMAEALVDENVTRYELDSHEVVGRCQGSALEGQPLIHPFYRDKQVPIILGDHVTTEAGTGAVHTAPGHGQDDFTVGLKYDLEVYNPVGSNGVFLPDTEIFAGQSVFKANPAVIELLSEKGALLKHIDIQHSYPHCWRHKSPIIFRATPQWFVSMDQNGLRDAAMQAITETQWMPEWGQKRIEGMVEGRPDWCVSRQRTWGVPIPLFVHKETGELHPDTQNIMEQVAQKVEVQGIDTWFDSESSDWLGDDAADYDKVSDTLDVWFDSGVSHACVLARRDNLHRPADLYLEGSDQHRGWFQSSLITSIASTGEAPYKSVLTHGFVVDAAGKKMSKSVGNVVAPQKVVNNLGADIIRLWAASSDYSAEMSVSDEILKRTADSYRRIRNTSRYLLSNLFDFNPATDLAEMDDLLPLDRWAVDRAYQCQQDILEAYESYNFHVIYQKIHNFCAQEMGSLYLDMTKDRQYTMQGDSVARRSSQTAMHHIIEALTRWMAPILTFTADELWEYLPGERNESVLLNSWYEGLKPLSDDSQFDLAFWEQVFSVRDAVSKELETLRADGKIKGGLTAEVSLFAEPALFEALNTLGDELKFVLITSRASLLPASEQPSDAIESSVSGLSLVLTPSEHERCDRCWHQTEEVGKDETHPELCDRCIDNVDGEGEKREFV